MYGDNSRLTPIKAHIYDKDPLYSINIIMQIQYVYIKSTFRTPTPQALKEGCKINCSQVLGCQYNFFFVATQNFNGG